MPRIQFICKSKSFLSVLLLSVLLLIPEYSAAASPFQCKQSSLLPPLPIPRQLIQTCRKIRSLCLRQNPTCIPQSRAFINRLAQATPDASIALLPVVQLALSRYWLRKRNRKKAARHLVQSIAAGWFPLATKPPRWTRQLKHKTVRKALKSLRKDRATRLWLRFERAMLYFESQTIKLEETLRLDTNHTTLFHNRLPNPANSTPATKAWIKYLQTAQQEQRTQVSKWHRKRRSRVSQRTQRRFGVDHYTQQARHRWKWKKSRQLAKRQYQTRTRAAQLRSWAHCSKQKPTKLPTRLLGQWTWQYKHRHHRTKRMNGLMRWFRVGSCLFGFSNTTNTTSPNRNAMFIRHSTPGSLRIAFYQKNATHFAQASTSSMKRIRWRFQGNKMQLLWNITRSYVRASEFIPNAADHWSLQATTVWTKK